MVGLSLSGKPEEQYQTLLGGKAYSSRSGQSSGRLSRNTFGFTGLFPEMCIALRKVGRVGSCSVDLFEPVYNVEI